MNKTTQVETYLLSLLQQGQFSVPAQKTQPELEQRIYQLLTRKKFRKTKMDPACVVRTKQAIHLRVSQHRPIKVMYPQGGYKLWRFPSSPEADWAEFFAVAYTIEYLKQIASMYEPGVELVFYMHTLLMEKHDNLSTKEIQAYVDSFQRLLDSFQEYLPKNFSISILRDADLYSRQEYFELLEQGLTQAKQKYADFPPAKQQDYLRMAELNIKWNGDQDWTKLSKEEKQLKRELAALYEISATNSLQKVKDLVKSPDTVMVFTKANADFIGIGSTHTSSAKYWVGFGVLERKSASELQARILTPSQYEFALRQNPKEIEVDVILGKNFQKIVVLPQPLAPTPQPKIQTSDVAVLSIIQQLTTTLRKTLGTNILGVYLYGSAAAGDFDPQLSDLDFLVILQKPLADSGLAQLERMHADFVTHYPVWKDRIEVAYVTQQALRTFKTKRSEIVVISPGEPLHRKDAGTDWLINWYVVRQNGITLFGESVSQYIPDISIQEYKAAVKQQTLEWQDWINHYNAQSPKGSAAYVVFTMCRALFAFVHGKQASKLQAATWMRKKYPEWGTLIKDAIAWRNEQWKEQQGVIGERFSEIVSLVSFVMSEMK